MAARLYILQAVLLQEDFQNIGQGQRNEHRYVRRNDINLPENKFLERYRISKAVALRLLEEIRVRLEYPNEQNFPLSPMQ
ncbi:hypothetical protein C0J52_06797 [Blattella germanica]|nr:hypothetical protein C0J52_06797 [Blattella germanica]